MADLVGVHGGLKEPVNRTVPAEELDAFKAAAAKLPKVPVSDADLSTVYRFGDGALSPLIGPMDSATYNRVLDESVHRARGQTLCLDDSARAADHERPGGQTFQPASRSRWRTQPARSWPRSTSATSSSGTSRSTSRASISPIAPTIPAPTWCSRGTPTRRTSSAATIRVLPQPKNPKFGKYVLSPREVRKLARQQGLEPRRRLSDAQPAAPGARICAGLRPGVAAARRAQRRRRV